MKIFLPTFLTIPQAPEICPLLGVNEPGVPDTKLGFSSSYWKLGGLCEVAVYHRRSKKESRTPLSLRIQQCFLEISVLQ